MPTLLVSLEGRTLRFDGSRTVRVGRSGDSDVLLDAGSVSRLHAELRPVSDGWMLIDVGSQFGTFVDGERVHELPVDAQVTVQCGPDARGGTFTAVPVNEPVDEPVPTPSAAAPPTMPTMPTMPIGVEAPTFAPPTGPPAGVPTPPAAPPAAPPGPAPAFAPVTRPPGALPPAFDHTEVLAAIPAGLTTPRTGPDLLVVAQQREFRFRHPARLRVGRATDSEVLLDDPVCSRLHAEITAVPGGWVYTNRSQEGTFDDEGRRVASQRFDRRLELRLGHPVASPVVSLVPLLSAAEEERRFARRRQARVWRILGAAAVVVLLMAGSVGATLFLTRDGDTGPGGGSNQLTTAELNRAKAATVLLTAETTDASGATVSYSGSGSIISDDGLILTNAHVGQPTADGLAEYYTDSEVLEDPEYLLVALVTDDDSPTEPTYRAELVEADGHRDAAVLRIYATADGEPVDPDDLHLPVMPMGDSDDLSSGDDITVLGFPGISGSTRLSVTRGVISTFIDRDDLGPRSEIDTDARIAPGNSGGAAIDNQGRLVGIPSSLFGEAGSPIVSGRIRPINAVDTLIDQAEAETR